MYGLSFYFPCHLFFYFFTAISQNYIWEPIVCYCPDVCPYADTHTAENPLFAAVLLMCVHMLTHTHRWDGYLSISFHLNNIELQLYQVLDTEVKPSESTHSHVTLCRPHFIAVHKPAVHAVYCLHRRAEGPLQFSVRGELLVQNPTPTPTANPRSWHMSEECEWH